METKPNTKRTILQRLKDDLHATKTMWKEVIIEAWGGLKLTVKISLYWAAYAAVVNHMAGWIYDTSGVEAVVQSFLTYGVSGADFFVVPVILFFPLVMWRKLRNIGDAIRQRFSKKTTLAVEAA